MVDARRHFHYCFGYFASCFVRYKFCKNVLNDNDKYEILNAFYVDKDVDIEENK